MNLAERDRFSSYGYGEGRTGIGQAVEFTCPPEDKAEVAEFLRTKVRTIDIPTTHRVKFTNGTYGGYTRYNIVQHEYGGSGPDESGHGGYHEVLEIQDPPDGRWGIVIHEYTTYDGHVFIEWESLQNARDAFSKDRRIHVPEAEYSKLTGFKRRVVCGLLTPWFYAIGDQGLVGDYAFPEGLQDDPVYRFGQKFLVYNENGVPSVKTCMGTRFIASKIKAYPGVNTERDSCYRLVCFDDGSIWDESSQSPWYSRNKYDPPRPIREDELWAVEAMQKFQQFLAGDKKEFTINFTDGNKFVGKLVRSKPKNPCAEGRYCLEVIVKGESKPREGWVDFKPTQEFPDVVQFVARKFEGQGKIVERVGITDSKVESKGKKWTGVFYHPPRS